MVTFRQNIESQVGQEFQQEKSSQEQNLGRELSSEEFAVLRDKYITKLQNQVKNLDAQVWAYVLDSTIVSQEYDALSLVVDDKKELMSYLTATNGFPVLAEFKQKESQFLDSLGNIDTNKIRSSAGLAANWYTPVGPLTFSFAHPITKASTDKTEGFRFNLGTSF